jgi:hypothetical protein
MSCKFTNILHLALWMLDGHAAKVALTDNILTRIVACEFLPAVQKVIMRLIVDLTRTLVL